MWCSLNICHDVPKQKHKSLSYYTFLLGSAKEQATSIKYREKVQHRFLTPYFPSKRWRSSSRTQLNPLIQHFGFAEAGRADATRVFSVVHAEVYTPSMYSKTLPGFHKRSGWLSSSPRLLHKNSALGVEVVAEFALARLCAST